MKYRNPVLVVCLSLITFALYYFYWNIKTSYELNNQGANIPIALPILIPIQVFVICFFIFNPWIQIPLSVLVIFGIIASTVYFYWLWRFSKEASPLIGRRPWETFLILYFLGPIGMGMIQNDLNETIP